MAAKVDAGLGHRRHAGRRNVLERQDGIALGGGLVGARRDHAVAVGVLQLEGDPGVCRHLVRVQLTGGEQELQILVTELVAVDRHLVRVELVVSPKALDVLQRVGQRQLGIPEARILNRLRVVRHLIGGQRVLGRKRPVGDRGESERLPREVDFILDVWRLPLELAGRHLESLDDAGKDHDQDESSAQPGDQSSGERRKTCPGGVDQQADGDQHHQHRHDPVGRNAGREVRVADAVDEAALAKQ